MTRRRTDVSIVTCDVCGVINMTCVETDGWRRLEYGVYVNASESIRLIRDPEPRFPDERWRICVPVEEFGREHAQWIPIETVATFEEAKQVAIETPTWVIGTKASS